MFPVEDFEAKKKSREVEKIFTEDLFNFFDSNH